MLRFLGSTLMRLAVAIVTSIVITAPLLVIENATVDVSDPVTITEFNAKFTVGSDGLVKVTEEITADFPVLRHGIFRYWDVADAKNSKVRFVPKKISVTRDGAKEKSELLWEEGRRYRVAKIGDANRWLEIGEHAYRIEYEIPGGLSPEGDHSRFEWQVVAGGWAMAMDEVSITVELPAEPQEVNCRVGRGEECAKVTTKDSRIRIKAENLRPNTPVRLAAVLPMAAPQQVTRPWPVKWDRVFGSSQLFVAAMVALALAAMVNGYVLERRSREKHPGKPLVFGPPVGLGPTQTHYVMHEKIGSNAFVATILQLAEQGVVTLSQNSEQDWTVTSNKTYAEWLELDPVARVVGAKLGLTEKGASFRANGSVAAGKKLSAMDSTIGSTTRDWANEADLVVDAPGEDAAVWLGILGVVIGVVPLFFGVPSIWFLPFGAFWIGGIGLLRSGVGTRRTEPGRLIWAEGAGFERFLGTKSSQERFNFSANKEMYLNFIPYAVAFGVADTWAKKYRTATNEEPPTPTWLGTGWESGRSGTAYGITSLTQSFESAVSSSISAYAATQSSSSSGGGGFSGGGGGGGGGGSW